MAYSTTEVHKLISRLPKYFNCIIEAQWAKTCKPRPLNETSCKCRYPKRIQKNVSGLQYLFLNFDGTAEDLINILIVYAKSSGVLKRRTKNKGRFKKTIYLIPNLTDSPRKP